MKERNCIGSCKLKPQFKYYGHTVENEIRTKRKKITTEIRLKLIDSMFTFYTIRMSRKIEMSTIQCNKLIIIETLFTCLHIMNMFI